METPLLCCVSQASSKPRSLSRAFGLTDPDTLSCDKNICYSGGIRWIMRNLWPPWAVLLNSFSLGWAAWLDGSGAGVRTGNRGRGHSSAMAGACAQGLLWAPQFLCPKDRLLSLGGGASYAHCEGKVFSKPLRKCLIPTKTNKEEAEVPLLNTPGNLCLFINFSCYTEQGSVQS